MCSFTVHPTIKNIMWIKKSKLLKPCYKHMQIHCKSSGKGGKNNILLRFPKFLHKNQRQDPVW